MIPVTLLSLAFLLIISIIGTPKSIKQLNSDVFFSVEQTNWLRGIAIIMVVLSHYYPLLGMTFSDGIISFSRNIGTVGVAIFFLLSGYATMISYSKKENYLNHYIPKRLLRLYVPFLIVFVLHYILKCIFQGEFVVRYLYSVPIMLLPDTPNWYLKVQICLYILFYIFAKLLKKNRSIIVSISIMCLLYMIVGYCLKIDAFWYETIFAFPVGMLLAYKKEVFFRFFRKHSGIYISFSTIILFAFTFPFFMKGGTLFEILFLIGCVQFVICICTCICGDFKLTSLLGKCSLELYLSHMVVIFLYNQFLDLTKLSTPINIALLLLYLAVSICLSLLVQKISNGIITKVQRSWFNK